MGYFFQKLLLSSFLMSPALAFCQTGKLNESFNKENKEWKLSKASYADSVDFSIRDGSLFIKNNNAKTAIIQYNLGTTSIQLGKDGIIDINIKFRHLGGINDFGYGISLGSKPDTDFDGGTNFAISGNGYYSIYDLRNKKQYNIKNWTKNPAIKTNDGEVNEMRILKSSIYFHLFINGTWVFTGNGYSAYNDYLSFFAYKQQEIAVDEINIKSYRGSFNKFPKHHTEDLVEICRESVNDFANAKVMEKEGQFKTWLSEVFICNKEYPIYKADADFFPKKVKNKKERFVYGIATDYKEAAGRDDMKTKLVDIIQQALVNYTIKTDASKEKKSTYFLSTNPALPAGVIVKLSEYTDRRSYEKEDHYYIKLEVMSAPDIKPF